MGQLHEMISRPWIQLWLIISFSSLSLLLFGWLGMIGVQHLYGFNLLDDGQVLTNRNDPFTDDATRLLLMFQSLGAFVFPALLMKQWFYPAGSVQKPNYWKKWGSIPVLAIIGALVGIYPFVNAQVEWVQQLPIFQEGGAWYSLSLEEEEIISYTDWLLKMDSWGLLAVNVLVFALIPAMGEELLFRGILQPVLIKIFRKPFVGITICALLFSLLHGQWFGFLPRFLLGVGLGYLAHASGTIWACILAHFCNNFLAIVLAFMVQQKFISVNPDDNLFWSSHLYLLTIGLGLFTACFWYLRKFYASKLRL